MAELDFSKIFGETATSKASFTDENYLNGWGYLGSTPPPYQLFDYLQSLNDKKSKYLYDKVNENNNNLSIHNTNATAHADIRQKFNSYLPLTGGTVTGTLNVPPQATADNSTKVANTAFVQSAVDNKIGLHNTNATAHTDIRAKITSDINSHNSNTSAHADIRTKITSDINAHNTSSSAHTAILNAIKAISGTAAYDIAPSRTLSSLIPLVGYGGIVAQLLETNGYIKFANGFTVQWGIETGIPILPGKTIQFPIAFNTLYGLFAMPMFSGIGNVNKSFLAIKSYSVTNFIIITDDTTTSGFWMAIGI